MKKKYSAIIISCIIVVLLICSVFVINIIITELVDGSNIVCRGQKFSSVEQAMQVMEETFREENDTSLDFCPPYRIIHHFECDNNTIVLHSYCDSFDGEESESYAVQILNHNDDGTLSFDCGFASFCLSEPTGSEDYYYFTNIKTSKGKKSISFLYLSKDSDKEIYVDGNKTEKELVVTQDDEFYICYAISKRDTFLSNLLTPIRYRHEIVVNSTEENTGSTKNENVDETVCFEDEDGNDDVFGGNENEDDYVFTIQENGNLVHKSGDEYAKLANEGIVYYLGDLEFLGYVKGEVKASQHIGLSYQTGMFAVKNDESRNILIRHEPNNEWFSIYRKTSLPAFDFSVDNCIRFELVPGIGRSQKDGIHISCGEGISEKSEITTFLSEIRMQKSPRDAGLYDMIKKPDGMLNNCYIYAVIYGFFEEEPNIVVKMSVTSYNDLAYSICIEGEEYVLPEIWLNKLLSA